MLSKCKDGVLVSLAIGSASAGALHAHLARARAANALDTSAARAAHTSLTRCACIFTTTVVTRAER